MCKIEGDGAPQLGKVMWGGGEKAGYGNLGSLRQGWEYNCEAYSITSIVEVSSMG